MVADIAVGEMVDLPVHKDNYDTDSESDVDDDTQSDKTFNRFGRATLVHFWLDLQGTSGQSGLSRMAHFHY